MSLTGARERVEMYIQQRTGETQFFVAELSELLSVKLLKNLILFLEYHL